MFGKRKQDRRHRFAEEGLGDDVSDDEATPEPEDPELAQALLQLGRNRHAPLGESPRFGARESDTAGEQDRPSALDASSGLDVPLDAPSDSVEALQPPDLDAADAPDEPDVPRGWGRAVVPTAAMLAEPERVQPSPPSADEGETVAAMRRERAKVAELEAGLRKAQDESQALRAQLKQMQNAAKATATVSGQTATPRTEELEESLRASQGRIEELTSELDALKAASADADAAAKTVVELQSTVSALTADLEESRAEAAAARVALERIEREAKDPDAAVAAAEARATQLAAEVEKLRAEAAKAPARLGRLHREPDHEPALRAALEQAQATQAQAEAALAENRRLASDLAANLQSQEGLIFALTGLQTEVTEQRAWFEAQIAQLSQADSQQTDVVQGLRAAIQERDTELQVLRQQLLEAEAKRAEEAAAFVAALESQ